MSLFVYLYTRKIIVFIVLLFSATTLVLIYKCLFQKRKWYNYVLALGIIVYLALILFTTLISRECVADSYRYSLIPFETYKKAVTENSELYREAFMNIALYYPLGLLYSCINTKKCKEKKWFIVMFSFVFSFVIELFQYLFHLGYAQIDDVIHNTLGAVIGIVIFVILDKLFDLVKSKIKNN